MKIYTKTGDSGQTSLFGGTRVPKYHLRIEAYGTVDELNSYIGLLKDQNIPSPYAENLLKIQNELFTIGSTLATPPNKETLKSGKDRLGIPRISSVEILFLEEQIDEMETDLPPMTHFILPGGHQTVSFCHIARCICRRVERLVVQLNDQEPVSENVLKYLNRLSDYLFVLARKLTQHYQAKEIPWVPRKDN
ncbi:cob(I)yrinic acid a,c-diamide adenosyltransferase [Flavobacteriaceae bacterium F08102]|nr:cob(I)yrinic acid a,c-diamide adenosyltransferase [Flavobacteriaceae bacterium F08102]